MTKVSLNNTRVNQGLFPTNFSEIFLFTKIFFIFYFSFSFFPLHHVSLWLPPSAAHWRVALHCLHLYQCSVLPSSLPLSILSSPDALPDSPPYTFMYHHHHHHFRSSFHKLWEHKHLFWDRVSQGNQCWLQSLQCCDYGCGHHGWLSPEFWK
jgi:hypothetical protein